MTQTLKIFLWSVFMLCFFLMFYLRIPTDYQEKVAALEKPKPSTTEKFLLGEAKGLRE